jgi:hypothetical protein
LAYDPEGEGAFEFRSPSLNDHHPGCFRLRPCACKERCLAEPSRAFHVSETSAAEKRPLDEGLDPLKLTLPLETAWAAVFGRGDPVGILHQTTLNQNETNCSTLGKGFLSASD